MANETIGHLPCAHCGQQADVRRYKTGARLLYYNCAECGIMRPSTASGQQWIRARAVFLDDPAAAPETYREPAAPAKAQDAPAAPKKRRGVFGGVNL